MTVAMVDAARPELRYAIGGAVALVAGLYISISLQSRGSRRVWSLVAMTLLVAIVLFTMAFLAAHSEKVSRSLLGAHTTIWYVGHPDLRKRILRACRDTTVRSRHETDCARARDADLDERQFEIDGHARRAWGAADRDSL